MMTGVNRLTLLSEVKPQRQLALHRCCPKTDHRVVQGFQLNRHAVFPESFQMLQFVIPLSESASTYDAYTISSESVPQSAC